VTRGQLVCREVAAALIKILAEISKNVNELETLPKTNRLLDELGRRGWTLWEKVFETDPSPKLTDTTGHSIGVVV
jgi:hypothetical protein